MTSETERERQTEEKVKERGRRGKRKDIKFKISRKVKCEDCALLPFLISESSKGCIEGLLAGFNRQCTHVIKGRRALLEKSPSESDAKAELKAEHPKIQVSESDAKAELEAEHEIAVAARQRRVTEKRVRVGC